MDLDQDDQEGRLWLPHSRKGKGTTLYTDEGLIKEVEKHKPLWWLSHKHYKVRQVQDRLWEEVAKKFHSPKFVVDAAFCMDEWKKFSRSRSRNVNRQKNPKPRSGSGAAEAKEMLEDYQRKKGKPYKPEKIMKFLDINQNIGKTLSNLSTVAEENEDDDGTETEHEVIPNNQNFNRTAQRNNEQPAMNDMRRNCCEDVAQAFEEAAEQHIVAERNRGSSIEHEHSSMAQQSSPIFGRAPRIGFQRKPLAPAQRTIYRNLFVQGGGILRRPNAVQKENQEPPFAVQGSATSSPVRERINNDRGFENFNGSFVSSIHSPPNQSVNRSRRLHKQGNNRTTPHVGNFLLNREMAQSSEEDSDEALNGSEPRINSPSNVIERNQSVHSNVSMQENYELEDTNISLNDHEGLSQRERAKREKAASKRRLEEKRNNRIEKIRKQIQERNRIEARRAEAQAATQARRRAHMEAQRTRLRENRLQENQAQVRNNEAHVDRSGVNWLDIAILDEVRGLREDDQSTHFCMSLAPRLRFLPEQVNYTTQIDILRLLERVES